MARRAETESDMKNMRQTQSKGKRRFQVDKYETWRLQRRVALTLIALRRERYLTQEHLAKESGLSRSTIAYIETAKGTTTMKNLSHLAQYFNVSVTKFFESPFGEIHFYGRRKLKKGKKGSEVFKDLPPGIEAKSFKLKFNEKRYLTLGAHQQVAISGVKGKVLVNGQDIYYVVEQGQSLTIPGEAEFSIFNFSRKNAECLMLQTQKTIR